MMLSVHKLRPKAKNYLKVNGTFCDSNRLAGSKLRINKTCVLEVAENGQFQQLPKTQVILVLNFTLSPPMRLPTQNVPLTF